MSKSRWIPLESNPEKLNSFLKKIGLTVNYGVIDVIGFDDELLNFMPKPIFAVVFLYPLEIEENGSQVPEENVEPSLSEQISAQPYFLHQTIPNACGTIALIHALGNNVENIHLLDRSPLHEFFRVTKHMTPAERAIELEKNDAIAAAHDACARSGETDTPDPDDNINLHFVAFVEFGGLLWELDGRKKKPIPRGVATPETVLEASAKYCREFIARNKDCNEFSAVALTKIYPNSN